MVAVAVGLLVAGGGGRWGPWASWTSFTCQTLMPLPSPPFSPPYPPTPPPTPPPAPPSAPQWASWTSFASQTVVSIAVTPALGAWSDLYGRKPFILAGQLAGLAPLLVILLAITQGTRWEGVPCWRSHRAPGRRVGAQPPLGPRHHPGHFRAGLGDAEMVHPRLL